MHQRLTVLFALAFLPFLVLAQLQSPSEFLPHQLGETFTPHHQLVDYFQHVAANSPNVQLIEYGRTNEGRPLILAIVSSPENMARIEAIRTNNLRHAGLVEGSPDASLDRAMVWLSYSVHGNEAAGSESSMGVVYDLANPNNAKTQAWLENTVVILDPSVNPDGYSRYTHWYRSVATTSGDISPGVREHREPWPGGRTNHYYFDLNRDWAWQTQVESQQRIVEYQRWMPHIHADLHEQWYNNPYYFAPAAQPYHAYVTDFQGAFQDEIGRNHAVYFDQNGWLYFTKEFFDLLYPSYGDTYPTFNGSIGMTYEQGGHSRAGRAILLPNTDTLTLHDRVAHHRTTSLSTIEVASVHAVRLLSEFSDYFEQAVNEPVGEYKTYIIKGDNPSGRLQALLALLDKNGIEYGRAQRTTSVSAFDYQSGSKQTVSIAANDLLISAYQPRSVLAQVLFDPTTEVADSLTYDITAWSMPYAYGLEAYASTSRVAVEQGYELAPAENRLDTQTAPYAYIVRWESTREARFLGQLLKAGVQVRYAAKPFQITGERYPAGTLVITKADNRKMQHLAATFTALAQEHNITVNPVASGYSEAGPDLGSGSMTLIKAPKVAMIAGEGGFSNEVGQVWYFFEQRLDYPIHLYYPEDLKNWEEDDIDILILPEGFYSLSEDEASTLTTWVRDGGKLITIGNAMRSLAGHSSFGLAYKSSDGGDMSDDSYGGQDRESISNSIPGAIFKLDMDGTHPLAYGLGDAYFSLKTGTMAFERLSSGWNVGTVGNDPMISGFVGSNAKEVMKNTLAFGVMRQGAGQLVYLVDNPLYRGFWENGTFLFSNALFMVD